MKDANTLHIVSSSTDDHGETAIIQFKSLEAATSMDACETTEHNVENMANRVSQNDNTFGNFNKQLIHSTTAANANQPLVHTQQPQQFKDEKQIQQMEQEQQQSSHDVELQMLESVASPSLAVRSDNVHTDMTSQKTFTIEQLELIRRLRNTGIAPDAIAEAFKELEKIENDLDTLQIATHNNKRAAESNNEDDDDEENEASTLMRSSDAIISGLQHYSAMPRSAHSSIEEHNWQTSSAPSTVIPAIDIPSLTARRSTENNLFRLTTSNSSEMMNSHVRENITNNSDSSEAVTLLLQQIHQQLTSNEQSTIQNNSTESLETLRTMLLLSQHIKLQQQQQSFQDYQKQQCNRRESPCALSPPPAKKFSLAATSSPSAIKMSNATCTSPLEPTSNMNITTTAAATAGESVSTLFSTVPFAAIAATTTSGSENTLSSLLDATNGLGSPSFESEGGIIVTPTPRRHSAITISENNALDVENYGGNRDGVPPLSAQAELKSRDLTSLLNSCGILSNSGKTNHRIINGDVSILPSELSAVLSNAAAAVSANSQLLNNLNATCTSSSTLFSLCRKRSASSSSSNASMSHNNDASTSTAIATASSSTSVNNDYVNGVSGNNNSTVLGSIGANFLNNTLCGSGNNSTIYEHFQTQPTSNGGVYATATTSASSANHNKSCYNGSGNGNCRPIRSQRTPMKDITTLDNPAELDEFMKRGEDVCINDMKQFITQFSLRQTTVAMMTGVSQPYISKLLNGNHRELSMRCRKNIYSWYLNCRRHPAKLALFTQDPSSRLETNGDGELIPQRRERYVFRPLLIKILEAYFANNQFPDSTVRMEIAQACNQALQMDKKGVQLMPKEVVTSQVIANWFANKRKEQRRKSHDEAVALAAASNSCNNVTYQPPAFTLPASNTVALLGSSTHSALYGPSAPPSSAPSALAFQLSSAAAAATANTASGNNVSDVSDIQLQLQKQQQEQQHHQQRSLFDNFDLSSSLLANAAATATAQTSSSSPIFTTSPSANTDSTVTSGQPQQFDMAMSGDGNNFARSSEGSAASASSTNDSDNYNSASSIIANIEAIRAAAAAAAAAVTANINEQNDDERKPPMTVRSALDSFLDNPHQHLQFLRRSSCVETSNNTQASPKAELTNTLDSSPCSVTLKQVNEIQDGNERDEHDNHGDEASNLHYDTTALTPNSSAINDYSCMKLELNFNYGNNGHDNNAQNIVDTIENASGVTQSPQQQKGDASCDAEHHASFLGSKFSPMAQSPNSGDSFTDTESGSMTRAPTSNFNFLFDPMDNGRHRFHCELLTNNLRQQQRQVVNGNNYGGRILDANPNGQLAAALFQNHHGQFHVTLLDNENTQSKAQRHANTAQQPPHRQLVAE